MTEVAILYLDIDGTVREGKDDALGKFVNGPQDVRVFPEAVKAMQSWKEAGGRIVGITNQGGLGLGILSEIAVYSALKETNKQTGLLFDAIKVCPHKPTAKCGCRKPMTGLITKAIVDLNKLYPDETYPVGKALFVGDRPEDKACAENAGVPFEEAHTWRSLYSD